MFFPDNFGYKIKFIVKYNNLIKYENEITNSTADVVVSCKIPILATRVRFPGDAELFTVRLLLSSMCSGCKPVCSTVPAWPNG